MIKIKSPEDMIRDIMNESSDSETIWVSMSMLYTSQSGEGTDIGRKYQQLFDDYNNYVRKVGHWAPPEELASRVEKSFLPYIRDVFSGRYQGKFEDHSSFPAVKAGMDAIIQHAKENPEYYELRDLIGN